MNRPFFRSLSWADIKKHPQYLAAQKASEEFDPRDGISYQWMYDMALERLRDAKSTIINIDNKAHDMAKYLGPGSAILGTGFSILAFKGVTLLQGVLVVIGLAIVSLVLSVIASFRVVVPHQQTLGLPIKNIAEVIHHFAEAENVDTKKSQAVAVEEKARGYCAIGIEESVAVLKIVADHKSARLKTSHIFFVVSFCLFLLAFLIYGYFSLWSSVSP
jgi:hypothetical protein